MAIHCVHAVPTFIAYKQCIDVILHGTTSLLNVFTAKLARRATEWNTKIAASSIADEI